MNLKISLATKADASALTAIAFKAKRHWGYPDEYFLIWESELSISEAYIANNIVYKAVLDSEIVGFYSLVHVENEFYSVNVKVLKGWWLEHIFILPEYHKQGIGKALIDHSKETLSSHNAKECFIFVDPYAKGFYEKLGAEFLYHSPSSIENREIPIYRIHIPSSCPSADG